MSKVRGPEPKATNGERQPLRGFALRLACLALLAVAGCSTPKGPLTGDPLLGGGAPLPRNPGKTGPGPAQGTAGTGQGTTSQPQASTVPPVPGIPTSGTGFSPAALAAGRPNPFDRNRDLQINDWPRDPRNNVGGSWNAPATAPRSNGSGVTLRPPEPLGDPGSLPGPASVPAPSTPAPSVPVSLNSAATREQVLAQLQARGILWQHSEMTTAGEWQFSCALPHPQNPNQQRTYLARGRDLVEAMQAVLEQIERAGR